MYDRESCKITICDAGVTTVCYDTVAAENVLRDVSAAKVIVEELEEVPSFIFEGKLGVAHITFGDGVFKISAAACSACKNLKSIELSDDVVSIGEAAFSRTGIESFKRGKGLRIISRAAFLGCPSLQEIDLNRNLVGIGEMAFAFCPKLDVVSFAFGKDCVVSANAFHNSLNNYGVRVYIAKNINRKEGALESGDALLRRQPYNQRRAKKKGKEAERLNSILALRSQENQEK